MLHPCQFGYNLAIGEEDEVHTTCADPESFFRGVRSFFS